MIDADGFRYNIGIILANSQHKVLLAKRIGQNSWQFPQGGIDENEKIKDALFRELYEEIGLDRTAVKIIGQTKSWLRYKIPQHAAKSRKAPYVGQKQKWFLLKFIGAEQQIKLDLAKKPEFDAWQWVNYWHPLRQVIFFKRGVYRRALLELAPLFWGNASKTEKRIVSTMLHGAARVEHHILDPLW